MRRRTAALIAVTAGIILASAGAPGWALDLGLNITRFDNRASAAPGWYNRGAPGEDQEVEPDNHTGQVWDLEGVFLKGRALSLAGGWNFRQGYNGIRSGDLFIDINGDARFGAAAQGSFTGVINHAFGYDYAVVFDFTHLTYDVVALAGAATRAGLYRINDGANPWRYDSGGSPLAGYQDIPFTYLAGLSDAQVGQGLTGGLHYVLTVDLGFLPPGTQEFICHFTLECGNDNLMGQSHVPLSGTWLLLGSGLVGLALWPRRRLR